MSSFTLKVHNLIFNRNIMLLLSIPLLITGCFGSKTLEDSLEDYHARLAYVLDVSLRYETKVSLDALPDTSTLKHNIEGVNINLREFYALQDCELGRIVALRNTALGKSQLPSQRFSYESALLHALSSCIDTVKNRDKALAATLGNWYKQKHDDFVKNWANLIQTSQEVRVALSTPARLLNVDSNRDALASINSLYYIDALFPEKLAEGAEGARVPPISSSELEQQLSIIRSARLPASVWQTQHTLATSLSRLTAALKPELLHVSCPNGRASEKAKILRNVFYLFFIEEIQPIGSLTNQFHYKLLPLWESWAANTALHPDFRAYITRYSEMGFASYHKAMQEHVALWQQFLGTCNLSPVAPKSH